MPETANLKSLIAEASGNKELAKQIKKLEKEQKRLEIKFSALKASYKQTLKRYSAVPKKKGRKPRPMIQVIEAEMSKKKNKTMKVTEIVKMLKQKKVKMKAAKPYSSVAAALSQNKKFEKAGVGEFRLVGEKKG